MFQVSRRYITLVLCLGKLKLVWDTAGTYCGRYSPQQTGGGYYWKKIYICPHHSTPNPN